MSWVIKIMTHSRFFRLLRSIISVAVLFEGATWPKIDAIKSPEDAIDFLSASLTPNVLLKAAS